MPTNWQMPRPNQGDIVLFSNDMQNFSSPAIGWVLKEPGHSTLQLLVFTEQNGWLVKPSVHHKDDPALLGDHKWHDLGVWDFTETTKAAAARRQEVKNLAREVAAR